MDIRMRVISIIFAVIAFILLEGYHHNSISNEESFYYALLVCGIISIILTALALFGLLENSNIQMLDNIYHTVAAAAVIVTSILFLISVFEGSSYDSDSSFARRLSSGILGLIYGLIMSHISYFLFRG